ncbi:MAG TPA: hypothetical protein PKD24_11890 [Pyrinomonadaceae bacterium]|nr:hypothetical protein [Pyrinomonadaceae bacterium]HMP65949.1 hypothetical protein [Pyrinomonadaceae bacterium]
MNRFVLATLCTALLSTYTLAQPQDSFDIATFKAPRGWKKQVSEDAILFSIEDKDEYCLITLFKSLPSLGNSTENFNAAWNTIVKEAVTVTSAPQMFPADTKGEWQLAGGFASFEKDGSKGVALLYTATGHGRMVNALVLTNTQSYEAAATTFLESISFKRSEVPVQQPSKAGPAAPARKSAFKFNTSNFDDGWTSTEQEDWVEVVKGQIKVLIHYPRQGTIFPADPEPLTNTAWDILVAPRYSDLRNYRTAYITMHNRPYLGMGSAVERTSGRRVFVILFRQGNTGWIEFVTPDKNAFIQQFRFDPETIQWNSDSDLMNPLAQMVNYNKFAVAATDFSGTWTSDFSGVQQLYNVYTGDYAGMHMNQSKEEFVFGAGNSYRWELLVVSGMVGNTKYANVKSAGTFTVPNNWQIRFSKIESGPKTYHAFWSCIKGARLLHLLNADAPGSGIYTVFGKK